MATRKIEKIPYKAYQIFKEKASKRRFRLSFYPWPVLVALLIPAGIFILAVFFYVINLKAMAE